MESLGPTLRHFVVNETNFEISEFGNFAKRVDRSVRAAGSACFFSYHFTVTEHQRHYDDLGLLTGCFLTT